MICTEKAPNLEMLQIPLKARAQGIAQNRRTDFKSVLELDVRFPRHLPPPAQLETPLWFLQEV